MNLLKKVVFSLLLGTGSFLLLLIIISGIIIALEIRIELNVLRKPVETAVAKALNRDVHFNGNVSLVPTLWPTLEILDVQIENPSNWPKGIFADAKLMRIQLGVLPLLRRSIHLGEMTIADIQFNLSNNRQGIPNWRFKPADDQVQEPVEITTSDGYTVRFEAVDTLALENIDVFYQDQQLKRSFRFHLDEMQGSALPGEPVTLDIKGHLENKSYQAHIEGGSIADLYNQSTKWPLKIKAKIAGAPLTVKGAIRGGEKAELQALITLRNVDIGATLEWLGLATGMQAEAEELTIQTTLHGDSLNKLLSTSQFQLMVEDAKWILEDANTGAQLPIIINKGELNVGSGKAVRLSLNSQIDETPINIRIQGSKLADYARAGIKHPLDIHVQAVATELSLNSRFTLPIDKHNLGFSMQLQGQRLDSVNQLLGLDLPPIGPYSLAGDFAINEQGYAITNLLLKVGSSNLQGNMHLTTTAEPPNLDVKLESQQLQIDDFNVEGWSVTDNQEANQSQADDLTAQKPQTQTNNQERKLLSPEVFNSLSADVDIQVNHVLSGEDTLGKGSLHLTLDQGRLSLQPLLVEVPGGSAKLEAQLFPTAQYVEVGLKAMLDKFDYGILARRIDQQSETVGKLSLDVDLNAKVKDKKYLLANGTGHFDFAVWPGNMDADVFDLWAVNLLTAVVSNTDKEGGSKVNCVVAGFKLNDGIMQQKILFVDTSKMQIEGTADVNFKTKQIELYVEPKAKRPEFFSLATPVKVKGSFADFGIGINPARLAGSVLRFVTSPVLVPLHRLFTTDQPADGQVACETAWKMRNIPEKK